MNDSFLSEELKFAMQMHKYLAKSCAKYIDT